MTFGTSTIRARIHGGFAIVLALLVAELAVALRGLDRIGALHREVAEAIDPPAAAAAALENTVFHRAIAVRNLVATGEERHRSEYLAALEEGRALVARLSRSALDPAARASVVAIEQAAAEHAREAQAFLDALDEGAAPERLAQAERRLAAVRERLLARIHELEGLQRARQDEARASAAELQRDVGGALVGTAILVAIALGATALLTVRALRRPALALVRAARAVEGGDYGPAKALAAGADASRAGELAQLARAFGRMAGALERREERLAAEGRVGTALAASLDPAATAASALDEVLRYCGATAGAVYARQADGLARLAGHLACTAPELAGEGIVDEALATGHPVLVGDIPADLPFTVRLGAGDVRPRSVAAVPLSARGERVGVVVVASLAPLDADGLAFAEGAADQLAVALQNAMAHRRVAAMAAELRASNERLQAQNEELQVQGEEIQAQAEELQAQADDIRRHSEDMRHHAEDLAAAKEALAQKAAALEAADRRKDEFLATLGHELRNPLAAVATAGQLLEAGANEGPAARHAAVIARQTGHLRRLVDDLLDLSRIDHGKLELRRERIDVRAVLRHAVEATADGAAAKSQRVALRAGEREAAVDGDGARLEQVLSNLLLNAIRYTPQGGTITASVAVELGEVVVRVGDTGTGIPHEILPRIFEPFIQGTHSEGGEAGLGLGLALVRRIVELHGGSVEARSDGVGEGTELVVRLPHADADAPEAGEPAEAAPLPGRRRDGDMRLQVVLVEDNPDVAETAADALELFGYAVRVARDAESGLRACLEAPPDVALLDIGLPGRSGHDLARDLRARLGQSVRLVAVTGYGQPEDRARAEAAGFDAHLVKPVDLDELRSVIERLAFEGPAGAAA